MSYILEALRKSERQRQAGQVPTLPALVADPPPRRQPWLAVMVVVLILFNIGGLGYLWLKGRNQNLTPAAGAQTPPVAGAPTAAKNQAPAVAGDDGAKSPSAKMAKAPASSKPQPPRPGQRAEPAKPGAANPSAAPVPSGKAIVSKPFLGPTPGMLPPIAEPPPGPSTAEDLPAPAQATRLPPPARATPAPPRRAEDADPPVRPGDPPLLRALPSDFRERVPAFKINLYAYSSTPAERFAIIDMKKYRVGDRIPGGALLLEMRADSLVLELDGTKFRVPRI